MTLILGHGIDKIENMTCKSVPLSVQENANFLVDTKNLKSVEDLKCDDNGCWLNNGVRKIYLVVNKNDNKSIKVKVVKRGGKAPAEKSWFLIRTYYVLKQSKDFTITMPPVHVLR